MTVRGEDLPPDVLRDRAVSFDDWCASFSRIDSDERHRLNEAAHALLNNASVMRVVAEIEKNAIQALVSTAGGDEEAFHSLRSLVLGVRAFRKALQKLDEDRAYKIKKDAV
jgi:hypothetical protein